MGRQDGERAEEVGGAPGRGLQLYDGASAARLTPSRGRAGGETEGEREREGGPGRSPTDGRCQRSKQILLSAAAPRRASSVLTAGMGGSRAANFLPETAGR